MSRYSRPTSTRKFTRDTSSRSRSPAIFLSASEISMAASSCCSRPSGIRHQTSSERPQSVTALASSASRLPPQSLHGTSPITASTFPRRPTTSRAASSQAFSRPLNWNANHGGASSRLTPRASLWGTPRASPTAGRGTSIQRSPVPSNSTRCWRPERSASGTSAGRPVAAQRASSIARLVTPQSLRSRLGHRSSAPSASDFVASRTSAA